MMLNNYMQTYNTCLVTITLTQKSLIKFLLIVFLLTIVKYNREYLCAIIETIILFIRQNLPLRGHHSKMVRFWQKIARTMKEMNKIKLSKNSSRQPRWRQPIHMQDHSKSIDIVVKPKAQERIGLNHPLVFRV